jgi:tetratricopeptide (TPR) repeat protein
VIRKREPRWQSATERARVAAELIEEAESLTETSMIASPADVRRASLPPPIQVELPREPPAPLPMAPAPPPPPVPPSLDGALAAEPDNVALLVERARRLAAAGHYSAAQRDLEQALRSAPAHADALAGLGVVFSRKGLWGEAVPWLRRVVEAEPGRALAWCHLGEALNKVDDLLGARGAYERAIELEPRNAKALYGLGIVLDRLGRPEDATRMYRRSREAAGR